MTQTTHVISRRPPEIFDRDSEERRPLRYAGFRITVRCLLIVLVLVEIVLVGPSLPLWLGLAGIIYAIDQVRIVLDTRNPCDLVIRPKPELRRDPRFLVLFALTAVTGYIVLQGLWFPIWFPARDGYLWWETATARGRILPAAGALMFWVKIAIMAGIPFGLWDPLSVLDWVYKIESVWTQYRNTQFVPADPADVNAPTGTISQAKAQKRPEPIEVALTSPAPLPATATGATNAVHAVVPHGRGGEIIDL